MKKWMIAVSVFVGLGLVAALVMYGLQRQLIYPAPAGAPPQTWPEGIKQIDLGEGYGLFLRPNNVGVSDATPLLIYCHGNAEAAFWSLDRFDDLLSRGISVLIVEYPGYGGAAGSPSRSKLIDTVLTAYDTMAARDDILAEQILAYGHSLGGGVASALAAERPLRALGLQSTFTSLSELVDGMGVPPFLLRDNYRNLEIVEQLQIPVFVYHGKDDDIIPPEHGRRLAEAAARGMFVSGDCKHANCPTRWPEMLAFFDEHGVSLGARSKAR